MGSDAMSRILASISEFVSGGLSFLGLKEINVNTISAMATQIIMQILATILLLLIVKHFFWGKITKILDDRQELIMKNLTDAQRLNEEAKTQKALALAEYAKAKEMARDIIDNATNSGKREKEQIINDAKNEAKRRMIALENDLKAEIENSKKDMKNAIVDIAFLVAEKIVKEDIDKDKYQKTVYEFIEELGK